MQVNKVSASFKKYFCGTMSILGQMEKTKQDQNKLKN